MTAGSPADIVAVALLTHAALLGSWAFLGLLLVGQGLLLRRAVSRSSDLDLQGFLGAAWSGLAIVVALLQLWHFVLPIDDRALLMMAAVSGGGWIATRRTVLRWLRGWERREVLLFLAFAGGVGLVAANRAAGPAGGFDTGAYHLPAVQWFQGYPAVPGLANLHGSFGFNNANLLYASLLGTGPWTGLTTHLTSGSLVYGLLLWLGVEVHRRRRQRGSAGGLVFHAVLIAPAVALLFSPQMRGLSSDLAVTSVVFVAASMLYGLLEQAGDENAGRKPVQISLLLALAITFKLSTLAFAVGAFVVAAAAMVRSRGVSKHRVTAVAGLGVALLLVPWLGRGVVLSGYPLYPAGVVPVPVEWQVTERQLDAIRRHIRAQARGVPAETEATGTGWLRGWMRSLLSPPRLSSVMLPLLLAAAAILWRLFRRRLKSGGGPYSGRDPPRHPRWLLLPIAVGLLFWLTTAPAPRFAYFLFWSLAAVAGALAVDHRARWIRRRSTALVVLAVALGGFDPGRKAVERVRSGTESPLGAVAGTLVWKPTMGHWAEPVPEPTVQPYATRSGLTVHVPVDGPQCWDAPLPCTPYPFPGLEAREAGRLAAGFRTRGEWRPLRWPGPAR